MLLFTIRYHPSEFERIVLSYNTYRNVSRIQWDLFQWEMDRFTEEEIEAVIVRSLFDMEHNEDRYYANELSVRERELLDILNANRIHAYRRTMRNLTMFYFDFE